MEALRGVRNVRRHLIVGLASALVAVACEAPARPPSDPGLRAELGIPDETPIHRVDLGGPALGTSAVPRFLVIHPGDVVQFVVLDHRVHQVRFLEEGLGPAQLAFLRDTAQDRPPPLVEQGARLVLTFEDAPIGAYAFVVEGYGAPLRGEIRVLPR